jgi:hypothetical protein
VVIQEEEEVWELEIQGHPAMRTMSIWVALKAEQVGCNADRASN